MSKPSDPLWSVREVRELLTVVHGGRRRSDHAWYPDTAQVALEHSVSRRTVERWVQGDPAATAGLPRARRDAILLEHRPTEKMLRREAYERSEVQEKRRRRNLGRGRGNLQEYAGLGWLERHVVSIVQEDHSPLRRILTTRADSKSRLTQERGVTTLSTLEVRDKIDAESIRYEVLRLIDPWRLRVDADRIARGGTQIWLESAPLLPLASIFNVLRLDDDR